MVPGTKELTRRFPISNFEPQTSRASSSFTTFQISIGERFVFLYHMVGRVDGLKYFFKKFTTFGCFYQSGTAKKFTSDNKPSCSDEGLTLETSAKHHIPQATNIPYQPCWSNPYSAYSPTQKTVFFKTSLRVLQTKRLIMLIKMFVWDHPWYWLKGT